MAMTLVAPTEDERPPATEPPALPAPVPVALRLRPPVRQPAAEHFAPTDPSPGADLSRHPKVARALRNRRFQFFLILPNQIIFWAVIFLGILGTLVPGLNFATAITWYIWFCLVFVLMLVVGRGWCAMCPFGGFAEWLQRRSFWRRTQRALGLGKKLPEPIARYGLLLSIGTFIVLTWIEERFNIAGPGTPADTGLMVIGIVAGAVLVFSLFERRTFCRYICPLSALIGTVGAMGSVAGFRTKDRQTCLACPTKDCMRGGEQGYGCPWYTWPGSADSNLTCGLCSECYKACPSGNVGLFVQKPLTSVVQPRRRRADVAWAVMALWGLVIFQQVNATNGYAVADSWLATTSASSPSWPSPPPGWPGWRAGWPCDRSPPTPRRRRDPQSPPAGPSSTARAVSAPTSSQWPTGSSRWSAPTTWRASSRSSSSTRSGSSRRWAPGSGWAAAPTRASTTPRS
ncbi:4Fe-4S binding protein [Aciditerrimonas ferrireducens]|uniref:4Fe-4S binding protein n=1 Tax=Aciditerrimonas ferrireducens TaxID=667306 RepID=UPI00200525AB|nr:4Fe-4S binding protein [Aciditerrimonas ferrireducens]MCK4177074.1 4Fe-4S binding protein [Aciditerrimonas ferrireducens]